MALTAVSNTSLWSSTAPNAFKQLPTVAPRQPAATASALPIVSSGSVASAKSASSSSSAASSSSATVVPQDVLTALYDYVSPTQQAWTDLTQSLKSGNLSAAQTALGNYTASLSAPNNSSMLVATTPSATFLSDLTVVGNAITAGSLTDARTAFATATSDRPARADEVVNSEESETGFDGSLAIYGLEHPSFGATINWTALWGAISGDISSLDGGLREEQANIGDNLVALGYSRADATKYAGELTQIGNASATDNAAQDTTRAAQFKQGIIELAQNATAASGTEDQVSKNLSSSVSTLLTGIEFANIDAWKQLQVLIGATVNTSSS